jgi:hypothetical protein
MTITILVVLLMAIDRTATMEIIYKSVRKTEAYTLVYQSGIRGKRVRRSEITLKQKIHTRVYDKIPT